LLVRLKVLIVSGIWPPDVGGPASHAPEFGRFLLDRGHEVHAVTSSGPDGPLPSGFPVVASRRDRPRAIRVVAGGLAVARAARWPDVVYSTGLYYKSAVAVAVHRRPLVVKLTTDPAYERARRLGLFTGDVAAFQRRAPSAPIRYLKSVRTAMLARAARVVVPSRYLAQIAHGWGLAAERVIVVPNPAPAIGQLGSRDELRRRLGVEGVTFVFVGRLAPAKDLPLALSALRDVPDARLVIVGDGPERHRLDETIVRTGLDGRVTLKGALPRSEAIEWLRAADAAVLSSAWENLPHAAVEAIAVGTPVVATAVGGVPEVVEAGVNGLLVAPGDRRALAAAMRSVTTQPELSARLRQGAQAAAGRYGAERLYAAIERELLAAHQERLGASHARR
jgi:glycosyltransferase involved in cell wall biosynthesis